MASKLTRFRTSLKRPVDWLITRRQTFTQVAFIRKICQKPTTWFTSGGKWWTNTRNNEVEAQEFYWQKPTLPWTKSCFIMEILLADLALKFRSILKWSATLITTASRETSKKWLTLGLIKCPKATTSFQTGWVFGNHDNPGVVNRFGLNRGDAINMMVQTLPGVAITYYGKELAMTDQWISWNDTIDPQGCGESPETYASHLRDPARTPFQWDDSRQAGFSTSNKTWLPVADSFKTANVKRERLDPNSHLNVFKRLVRMRKLKSVLQDRNLETVATDNLLILKRQINKIQLFVVLNFGAKDKGVQLTDYFGTTKSLVSASVVSSNSGIRRGWEMLEAWERFLKLFSFSENFSERPVSSPFPKTLKSFWSKLSLSSCKFQRIKTSMNV